MAAPAPTNYSVSYSFTGFQAVEPAAPPPGGALDSQFYAIQASIASVTLALADIRRADGFAANASVKPESLHASTTALLGTGFNPRGAWLTATAYAKGDLVQGTLHGATYVATEAHTSGVFLTDVAAVKWLCLAPFSPGQNAFIPPAGAGDAGKILYATGADTYAWNTLIGAVGFRNRLINADFQVNQRGFVSGASLAAGVYGHDRWKGGASGCTYAFGSVLPSNSLTISAGTLIQVVEGGHIDGGTYVLTWSGTAQARVNGGAYSASPLTVAGLTAGVNVTVEFGTGTLAVPQFESNVATTYERRPPAIERLMCERYYRLVQVHAGASVATGGDKVQVPVHWPAMRAAPAATVTANGTSTNAAANALEAITAYGARFAVTSTSSGKTETVDRTYALDAEL
jgi:hypothetical protein